MLKNTSGTILITGGAGYIGSKLALQLAKKHTVTVVDNLSAGLQTNLPASIRFHNSDITSLSDIDHIISTEKPDCIYHLAASKSVNESIHNSEKFREINVRGSIHVIDSAIRHGVSRFIFTSTAGVYGDVRDHASQNENDDPSPSSPYAETKLEVEKYLLKHVSKTFSPYIVRFANVYGPGGETTYESVVNIFIKQMLTSKPIEIHGDGSQTRDFIYIDDLIDACEVLYSYTPKNERIVPIYNIGTSKSISINALIANLVSVIGVANKAEYAPTVFSGQHSSMLNSIKAKRELGWNPKTTLLQGIAKTVAHYRKKIL
jgi:UDP-glucose 4-epimerase